MKAVKIAAIFIAAGLTGCSLPPASTPVSRSALNLSTRHSNLSARSRTWMSPDASGKSLLYVSYYSAVQVYDYETDTQVGNLSYFAHAGGSCTDAHGNVYIANYGDADVLEFSHGGTKPRYIVDPSADPVDCSIDPTTGNLAVINGNASPGNVAIYAGGKGKPKVYKSPFSTSLVSGAYDPSGNLLVSAYQNNTIDFAMLPAGKTKMESVTLPYQQDWYGPAYVRWDGEYFVVDFQTSYTRSPAVLIMYTLKGTTGEREGYSIAQDSDGSGPFWLGKIGGPKNAHRANQLVFCSRGGYGGVLFYDYPQGGEFVFDLDQLDEAGGATVSL